MDNGDKFESKIYKRSRSAYRMECAFERFTMIFMADAFLVTLLKYMDMKDSTIGIIVSFTSFAYFSQILAAIVAQKIRNTKKIAIIFHTSAQLIQVGLFTLPFIPLLNQTRGAIATVCVLVLYCFNYFATPIIYNWGNSFVDPKQRARFSSVKEIIMIGGGMVLTLVFGYVMDDFKGADNLEGGFIFCAIGIFAFCIGDLVCLLLIKNTKKTKEESESISFPEIFKIIFKSEGYVSVVVVTALWNVALYTSIGFLGTYMLGELGYSVFAVQLINICGNFAGIGASKPIGKFSDKYSFAKGIELGLVFAAVAFLMLVFTSPATKLLIIGYMIFYSIASIGVSVNLLNIPYSYVDSKYFLQAAAIRSSIGGICGICVTLLSSRLMEAIKSNGNKLFGITVYSQQVMGAISLIAVIVAFIYTRAVLVKQKTLLQ